MKYYLLDTVVDANISTIEILLIHCDAPVELTRYRA